MKPSLILSLLIPVVGVASGQGTPQKTPATELEISLQPQSAPRTFHLQIINRGSEKALVIRPRARMLDGFELWGGWHIAVQGPHGAAKPLAMPGSIGSPVRLDLIELRPGESAGVIVDLRLWTIGHTRPWPDVPGKYTVVVRYHYDQGWVLGEKGTEDRVDVPTLLPVESRPLQFVVQDGTREE